jgi:hypothetical protein
MFDEKAYSKTLTEYANLVVEKWATPDEPVPETPQDFTLDELLAVCETDIENNRQEVVNARIIIVRSLESLGYSVEEQGNIVRGLQYLCPINLSIAPMNFASPTPLKAIWKEVNLDTKLDYLREVGAALVENDPLTDKLFNYSSNVTRFPL